MAGQIRDIKHLRAAAVRRKARLKCVTQNFKEDYDTVCRRFRSCGKGFVYNGNFGIQVCKVGLCRIYVDKNVSN